MQSPLRILFYPSSRQIGSDYDIERSIELAVESGVRELVTTGGEPTLQKTLPNYIQKASDMGVRRIVLQTNGVRLADPIYTKQLADAGLSSVVILHSHQDEVLTQLRSSQNAMNRTLTGIQKFTRCGCKNIDNDRLDREIIKICLNLQSSCINTPVFRGVRFYLCYPNGLADG